MRTKCPPATSRRNPRLVISVVVRHLAVGRVGVALHHLPAGVHQHRDVVVGIAEVEETPQEGTTTPADIRLSGQIRVPVARCTLRPSLLLSDGIAAGLAGLVAGIGAAGRPGRRRP